MAEPLPENIKTLTVRVGGDRELNVAGREAWALARLIESGPGGCTPISRPAPRWSEYIRRLRSDRGLAIETVRESHGGAYSGSHGRYVLKSSCEVVAFEAANPTANGAQQ